MIVTMTMNVKMSLTDSKAKAMIKPWLIWFECDCVYENHHLTNLGNMLNLVNIRVGNIKNMMIKVMVMVRIILKGLKDNILNISLR